MVEITLGKNFEELSKTDLIKVAKNFNIKNPVSKSKTELLKEIGDVKNLAENLIFDKKENGYIFYSKDNTAFKQLEISF